MLTLSRWVSTPENRSAFLAVQRVSDSICSGRPRREIPLLFLHGPAGIGKTHLVSALASEVKERCPELVIRILPANDLRYLARSASDENTEDMDQASWHGNLLIVENLQHLRPEASETLVQMLDWCQSRQQQMVLTCSVGPRHLDRLPARLLSRLTSGLVVPMATLSASSRLIFLRDRAQRRQVPVASDVLAWLANHLGGSGRQLEGAFARLEELVRLHRCLPDLEIVQEHFRAECEASQPTVEHITERVSRYFRVERRHLQSRKRSRNALVPRQISMYLARQLTELSLEQIGAFFGGRDHSTVLHACRKIDHALTSDLTLSGAVKQLQADLG